MCDACDEALAEARRENHAINVKSYDDVFPFCCAVGVLGHATIGDDEFDHDTPLPNDRTTIAQLKEKIEEAIADNHNGHGLVLYTTERKQVAEATALDELGFMRFVAEFKNPNSNSVLTLWAKPINQPRRRARR